MFLLLVTTTGTESPDFSFELLKVLVALSGRKPVLGFEVGKAVGYRGKLVCLCLPGNFSLIKTIQSLLHTSENAKVVSLNLIVVVCT